MARQRLYLALFLLMVLSATAHIDNAISTNGLAADSSIQSLLVKEQAFWTTIAVGVVVLFLVLISISYDHQKTEKERRILFLSIAIPIALVTLYIAGTTIYLNLISETQGPVHWHADFEIWNCGEKISLQKPSGLSNRLGNPVLHEHDDERIHVEGVVLEKQDVSLHHFFESIGGKLTRYTLTVPTAQGPLTLQDGNSCQGQPGKVQVFVYSILNPTEQGTYAYQQQKVEQFTSYVPSPYAQVPPGDCIIIEFDAEKDRTDHICASYHAAVLRGELYGS